MRVLVRVPSLRGGEDQNSFPMSVTEHTHVTHPQTHQYALQPVQTKNTDVRATKHNHC